MQLLRRCGRMRVSDRFKLRIFILPANVAVGLPWLTFLRGTGITSKYEFLFYIPIHPLHLMRFRQFPVRCSAWQMIPIRGHEILHLQELLLIFWLQCSGLRLLQLMCSCSEPFAATAEGTIIDVPLITHSWSPLAENVATIISNLAKMLLLCLSHSPTTWNPSQQLPRIRGSRRSSREGLTISF